MMHRSDDISDLLERSAAAVEQSREKCRKVRRSLERVRASLLAADAVRIDTRIAVDEMWQELSS